ncbi:MAG: hypothetical protein GXP26_04990 [Planctomycetes bacterium]|nr:hypothetical protein [Planctomycetota bacterium]
MTNKTTHCDACGQPTAVLAIQGEVSSQFICRFCGHHFERDNHRETREFLTKAKLQITAV